MTWILCCDPICDLESLAEFEENGLGCRKEGKNYEGEILTILKYTLFA